MIACARPARAEDHPAVTTLSLLDEMTDLERLTRPADYTCRQFSSYDRACGKGDPFANGDCGNYLRREGREWVLAEAAGPGAIVRIWSANPAGTLRIYLDGKVALEADFAALLAGGVEPFGTPFGAVRARGGNLYFPFPYRGRMKVTCTRGGQYYHVGYRTYPKGTPVETFDIARLDPAAVERARSALALSAAVDAPATTEAAFGTDLAGPGTIVKLMVDVEHGDRARACTLRLVFDGETCVECPLMDFFGTAPAPAHVATLPMAVAARDDGGWMRCTFPMPFERSARVEIDAAPDAGRVEGRLLVRPGACGPLRFHAGWRGSNHLRTRPMRDWPVLNGTGRGRYVGTALCVANPVKQWWGEGDEKVRVDGEAFPGIWGTGTEDYFGYAWCDPHLFSAPYHSQSRCDGPGNRGYTAVNRFHILDDIPFAQSIRFDLEVWHWADTEIGYATVAYWYAEPGFRADLGPIAAEDRRILPVRVPVRHAVAGALEGEKLRQVAVSAGVAEAQDMEGFGRGWSGDEQLWWRGAAAGDRLVLAFDAPAAGRRTLALALTKAPDYGIFAVRLNGQALLEGVDLYAPQVAHTGELTVTADLLEGENQLEVEVLGTNPAAHPVGYMFGLDYVRIGE